MCQEDVQVCCELLNPAPSVRPRKGWASDEIVMSAVTEEVAVHHSALGSNHPSIWCGGGHRDANARLPRPSGHVSP